jgi:transglutaminase-like putative cysteine protease
MNSPHFKNILIFLLSSVGLIVAPHIANIPIGLFGFFCLMLSWRFVSIWRPEYLPSKRLLLYLSLFALVLLLSYQRKGLVGRDAGTNMFLLALGLKLLEIKAERDIYLVTYLAFIVAASLFLYQQSLFMAAYILAVCCVLLATLVTINSIHAKTLEALKTAAIIIFQAIPVAVIIFVLFPRVEAPRWMIFQEKNKAKIGLSDSMEPGSISDLGTSEELVFRVNFTGAMPPPKQRYWRGPVLSYTDGKRWTQLNNQPYWHDAEGERLLQLNNQKLNTRLDKPVYAGVAYSYTLLLEAQEKNWVFALDLPAKFTYPLEQNNHYQLINRENLRKRSEYQITSYPQYNTGYLTKSEAQDNTQLPREPSEKIKQFVTQLHGFDSKPEVFIAQLLNHFRTEDFHYTLSPPLMEENPIESFLFTTRRGFCSHYASAFVYLMRVAHIPARIVTGYQGGEFNAIGNFLEVRQANAHAWAEVWIENQGWTRVDPTAAVAPQRIEQQLNLDLLELGGEIRFDKSTIEQQENLAKQISQLWENADYQWQRWVVNYDTDNQSDFLATFGIHDFKAMMKWLLILIALIGVLLSAFLLRQKQKAVDPVLRLYQRFCSKLQAAGLIRTECEGAYDFAQRAKIALPEQAVAIEQITADFIQLRYGRLSSHEDFVRFSKSVAHFKLDKHKDAQKN